MTNKEKEILQIIKDNPTIEQSEIAKLLNISRSTVAVHISSLEKKGYLLGKGYIINEDDYVLGIGAANVDVYGRSLIKLRTHYDHPAKIKSSVGGVMRNILCNYSLLGGKSKLITAYSDDSYGKMIIEDCKQNNIDISDSLLVKGETSGLFMQIQDENDDMYMAICDMSILERITPEYLESKAHIIRGAKIVVIDPSLTCESIEKIIELCKGKTPIYLDPVSTNYALKLKPYIGEFSLAKPNREELANLSGVKVESIDDVYKAASVLIDKGLKKVVVSLSKDGIIYMDKNKKLKRKLQEEKKMVNASGAGDALLSAIIYGDVNGLSLNETLDYGLAAGIAAIRSESTINTNMSIDLLDQILKEKKK